ncbi:DCBD1 protein, partial [Amia calva]|nr:DCBD1 protein [Amia calva]
AGEGCGRTVFAAQSGTLASRNFPGTYPNGTQCVWRLRAPGGRTLRLVFGDFDLEYSRDCSAGSLTITPAGGAPSLGPLCGPISMIEKKLALNTSEVTLHFLTGTHRSGRGFLLSYATDQHPDLISCMQRGIHLTTPQLRAFCPAGCKDVTGDIWGQPGQGYRDTSVLCKAAIHAGVVSEELGGPIAVSREKSLTLYESSFANGILSKTGSLSEKKLVFSRECQDELPVLRFNASSYWEEMDGLGRHVLWSPDNKPAHGLPPAWAPASSSGDHWLELELQEKSTVTGIITKGSADRNDFFVKAYTVLFSKDGKNWKVYKSAGSKEEKVFEGNSESMHEVQNSLIPPVLARYLLLRPREYNKRAALRLRVLGCPPLRPRVTVETQSKADARRVSCVISAAPAGSLTLAAPTGSGQSVLTMVGVAIALTLCVGALLVGVCWRRRKHAAEMKCSLVKAGKTQGCYHGTLPCPESELISYPLEMGAGEELAEAVLNDYAEPDLVAGVGQKLGSTFRPAADEGYTIPLILNHYDVPGKIHEYAEPLPPEPEYATPFSELPQAPHDGGVKKNIFVIRVMPPAQSTKLAPGDPPQEPQYDFPAQRGYNSYCTPQVSANGPRKASVVYAEPQPGSPAPGARLTHPYHEPL